MIVDFLANNYIWFLVITMILFFALIGYIVDTKEQKKWNAYGNFSKEKEQNFEQLAAAAKNQTLTQAMQMNQNVILNQNNLSSNYQNQENQMGMPILNNTIQNNLPFEAVNK